MKKNMFIFKPHSIVDIITNSSSELFVCNTDKTVDFIKKFISDFSEISGTNSECEVYQITEDNVEEFVDEYLFDWYVKNYSWSNAYKLVHELETKMEEFQRLKYPWSDYREHNEKVTNEKEDYLKKWKAENMETLKKDLLGNIIIKSSYDNSIDSSIFSALEDLFNSNRHHLG